MFAKVFQQIFDSSIAHDYNVRRMFIDMLVLADPSGVVDMTFEAIARRTGVPIDEVAASIAELMKPDPASRSGKMNGARLVFIDSGRDWGWRIVNYDQYRKLRDEEGRRSYCRDYMRDYMRSRRRKKLTQTKSNKSNNGDLNHTAHRNAHAPAKTRERPPVKQKESNSPRLPSENVRPPLDPLNNVKPRLAKEEEEGEEEEVQEVPSAVSLPGRQSRADIIVHDRIKLKKLICEKILCGKNPGRVWSADAENRLAIMAQEGVPLTEILDIAWFRSLSKNDEIPELKKRRDPVTETGLMQYWGDESRRASEYRKKITAEHSGPIRKPEPERWREFYYWKHDDRVVLPKSFWDLDRDLRNQYDCEFQTFVRAEKVEA